MVLYHHTSYIHVFVFKFENQWQVHMTWSYLTQTARRNHKPKKSFPSCIYNIYNWTSKVRDHVKHAQCIKDGPLLAMNRFITPIIALIRWVTGFFHPGKWSYFTLSFNWCFGPSIVLPFETIWNLPSSILPPWDSTSCKPSFTKLLGVPTIPVSASPRKNCGSANATGIDTFNEKHWNTCVET